MEIVDSLSKKDREQFLDLTSRVNLLNCYIWEIIGHEKLLRKIDSLYDGKLDFIHSICNTLNKIAYNERIKNDYIC
jgi:hypothetical protein